MSYSRQGSVREQMRFLRRQFLQDGGLPFTDILSEEVISQALKAMIDLNAGHGQLIGHTKLSQHFRAEIAQHNQSLQWPVLTRTWVAGFERAMTLCSLFHPDAAQTARAADA